MKRRTFVTAGVTALATLAAPVASAMPIEPEKVKWLISVEDWATDPFTMSDGTVEVDGVMVFRGDLTVPPGTALWLMSDGSVQVLGCK